MIEIKRAISLALSQLEQYTDSPRMDVEILLAHVLQKNRTWLYTWPDALLTKPQFQLFQQYIAKRSLGIPVAYITGTREFWSLPLKVTEETLIPRPETELLVELALSLIFNKINTHVLDLGTGSGAIALALAREHPDWQITACDYSLSALQTAQDNATSLTIENINFVHSDWFDAIDSLEQFDAIVSNPPYIAANDVHLTQGDVRFEPQIALVGGIDGLSALEHIIKHSLVRLKPDGLLLMEHGFDQKCAVMSILKRYGYRHIQSWQDLNGNDRVSGGRK